MAMTVPAPAVRAPLLAERRWPHLIVCATRIPPRMPPFAVPTLDAHHLVTLASGGLRVRRRGLGTALAAADMSAGEVYVTAAGTPAYDLGWSEPPRELRAVHVLLDRRLTDRVHGEAVDWPQRVRTPVAVVQDELLAPLMHQLRRSLESPACSDELYVDVLSELLALQLVRSLSPRQDWTIPSPGRLSSAQLRRVNEYIQAQLQGEIRLAALAAEVGMGRFHFVRAFKGSTGRSPHAYVVECRLEEGRRLLLDTRASLAEIALATGFSSQSHFTTRFRQATGVTPKVFRQAAPARP